MLGEVLMRGIFLVFLAFFIFSCTENKESNKCDGVTCSGKGACVVNDSGKAQCNCFDGYIANDLECKSACDGIECSNHGTCKLEAGAATCECDDGYEAYGTDCLDKSDLCNGVTCGDHGTCKIVDDKATCTCDEGYSSDGTECKSICDGFDCSNHGECVIEGDGGQTQGLPVPDCVTTPSLNILKN
jgi:hypothetical protein